MGDDGEVIRATGRDSSVPLPTMAALAYSADWGYPAGGDRRNGVHVQSTAGHEPQAGLRKMAP